MNFSSPLKLISKTGDAVVEAVGCVDESSVGGDAHLGAEAGAFEARRQRGDHLHLGERAVGVVVAEDHQGGGLFGDAVQPASVGMEEDVARAVAGWDGDEWGVSRGEDSGVGVEAVDVDSILAEIGLEDEFAVVVGEDAVGVRRVVSAEGEAAGRRVGGYGWADVSDVDVRIDGGAEGAVSVDGEDCDAASAVVGDEEVLAGGVDT